MLSNSLDANADDFHVPRYSDLQACAQSEM